MNAVVAAVLLAVVATCSGTSVVSTLGGSQLLYTAQPGVQYQYVNPSSSIQYVQQPYVSSSSIVQSSVPVTYANQAVIPSTYSSVYGLQYPYSYGLGYGYSLLKK